MKINLYILLMIILMLPFSFAFTIDVNWGNSLNRVSCPYWLWSSCYPQNNLLLNFTEIQINQLTDFSPMVMYNMVDSFDPNFEKRFIYTFSGTSMNIYDGSDGSLYSSNILNGKFISKPNFIRLPNDLMAIYGLNPGYLLYGIMNVSNSFRTVRLYMDDNKNIQELEHEIVSNQSRYYATNLLSNNDFIPVLLANGTINFYTTDGIYYASFTFGIGIDSNIIFGSPEDSNPIIFEDINNDGYNDVFIAMPYETTDASYRYIKIKYWAYDLQNSVELIPLTDIEVSKGLLSTNTAYHIYQINNAVVRYGAMSSANKLYTHIRIDISGNPVTTVLYNQSFNLIMSQTGTVLYNDFYSGLNNKINSNIAFTDYDYDNSIEECYNKNGVFVCYNTLFVNELSGYSLPNYYYIGMGKLTNNSYMSVILKDSIWDINTTWAWNVHNFTNYETMTIAPVSMFNKLNYSNDIFGIGASNIYLRLVEKPTALCGDGICSAFESPLTCEADCFIHENASIVPLKNTGEYCTSNSECASDLCDIGKCSLKIGGDDCTSNSQCLSGICSQQRCTQAGSSEGFKLILQNLFGFSDSDGVIVYLLIAVVLFIIGCVASVMVMHVIPVIASIILDVIILIGFTFIGITPAWLLLVIFIFLALISFILFMLFSGQN